MSVEPSRLKLYSAILAQQVLGALAFPITKIGLVEIPPFSFALIRFIIASVILMSLVGWLGEKRKVKPKDAVSIAALGVMIVWLNQTLYIWGQSYTSAAHGSLLFAITPIFAFVLSIIILKERFSISRGLGSLLAVLGAVIVIMQSGMEFNRSMLIGDLMILLAVLVWAIYTVWGKPLVQRYGAFKVTAYATLAGTISYLPFGIYHTIPLDLTEISYRGWLAALYMGSGLSVGAYVLWYWAVRHFEITRIAPFHNIQPVIATVLAYYMIGETIAPNFVYGGALVIGGVLVVELTANRKRSKRVTDEPGPA